MRGPPEDGTDRAQLLLVGAVAIALIFLALVVVFNTVLFTDSTTPTEPLESAEEARSFEEQVRNDTRQIMIRVANETGETECTLTQDFCDYTNQNISEYSLMVSTSYAETGPVYAGIEDVEVAGELGGAFTCNALSGLDELCVRMTVVYETNEFEYRNTIVVAVEAP